MKIRKYAVICYILVLAMILPLSSMAITPKDEQFVAPGYAEPYIEGEGNSALSISLEHVPGESLNILVTDSRTGKVWESNPIFTSGDKASLTDDKRKELSSQILLQYTYDKNGNASSLADVGYVSSAATTGKFTSIEESIEKNQLKIQMILDNDQTIDYYEDDSVDTPVRNKVPAGRTVVGYRVTYGFGDEDASLYPVVITESRMNELLEQILIRDDDGNFDEAATEKMKKNILSKYELITIESEQENIERQVKRQKTEADKASKRKDLEKALKNLIADYPVLEEEGLYRLYSDATNTTRNKKLLVGYWQSVPYTRDDLEYDNELTGYEQVAGSLSFSIPVEYIIEGNTFRATILTDEIEYPAEVAITRLDFLPSFGGADDTVQEGYTFVPDGSGALIEINNPDQRMTGYQVAVMNRQKDEALNMESTNIRDIPYYEYTILPVFGQKQDDNAYFCIIEEGYEFTNITAYIADSFTKYNTAFASFFPTTTDEIYYSSGSSSGIAMFPKVEVEEEKLTTVRKENKKTGEITKEKVLKEVVNNYCRLPATNMTVRFAFLSGDKANYVGMAEYYRTYLMNTYDMSKRTDDSKDMTFYADIYGIIDKKVSFAGFPVNRKFALTTFEEAEIIVQALIDNGVEDLNVRYLGMINGGLKQTYANKFKVESNLGGKKGYKKFLAAMDELGVGVYPNIDVTHVYQDKIFDGFSGNDDTVMTLGKTQTIIYDFNIATGLKDNNEDSRYYHPRWVVSPRLYEELFDTLQEKMEVYGNKNVSLGTLGSKLFSDYNEDCLIDRGQTARVIADQLRQYRDDGYDIIVEKGMAYTLPYVSTVLDIPMTSSKFVVESYEIPFVQIVLHGMVEYAGEPFNVTQDVQYTILKCLEYGATVYGRFMYQEDSVFQNTYYLDLYSLNYEHWMSETQQIYTAVNEAIGDVQTEFIVNHERLADNVYRTTYENGKQVIVNYNTEEYVCEELGVTIEARGYYVTGGAQ